MAEEFAFHQLGRNRAAVDGNERALAPGALQVNHPRYQFFTATGFPADKHRRLAAGKFSHLATQSFDFRRVAQQQAGIVVRLLCIESGLREFECTIHQLPQARQFHRF